ncbi:MAG TPA: acylphosphatase [Planctomycetota bacterium]|nr:acylphosphatase [Planctomycetota bacterium]
MSRRRIHVWIEGVVQGVFFRARCSEQAKLHGVSGWVRNLPDGRVEAVFEGESEGVEFMLTWCRAGPPRARVDRVEEIAEAPQREKGFRIAG